MRIPRLTGLWEEVTVAKNCSRHSLGACTRSSSCVSICPQPLFPGPMMGAQPLHRFVCGDNTSTWSERLSRGDTSKTTTTCARKGGRQRKDRATTRTRANEERKKNPPKKDKKKGIPFHFLAHGIGAHIPLINK